MPLNNPPVVTLYTSGSYIGDDADNRAIPHGLRAVPSLVIVACQHTNYPEWNGIVEEEYNVMPYTPAKLQVTAWDAVNFYVSQSTVNFNKVSVPYNWVAFV